MSTRRQPTGSLWARTDGGLDGSPLGLGPPGLVATDVRQARDPMSLQAAMRR
jgi:hypothetical protein